VVQADCHGGGSEAEEFSSSGQDFGANLICGLVDVHVFEPSENGPVIFRGEHDESYDRPEEE